MSYFKRESRQSRFLVDRIPVYVFPAFVGSGRILLGIALAGMTTAILLHTHLLGELLRGRSTLLPYLLAGVAYASSLILVVSGVYAINVIPPKPGRPAVPAQQREIRPPRPLLPQVERPRAAPAPSSADRAEQQTRLGDLLVGRWHLISERQLAEALARQHGTSRSLVYVLARMGLLTDEHLERILTIQTTAQDPWYDAPRHD